MTIAFANIFQITSHAASWYNSSWTYRQKLTVQSSKVPNTDQSNFPVYVDLSDMSSGFFTNVKSDGSDIVVTSGDGITKLSRELVSISTGSSTGELWFKAPSISSTVNTDFYIYYGNSGANEANDSAVWDVGYDVVQHFNEDPSTQCLSSFEVCNSSSTINNADTFNMGGSNSVLGILGQGLSLDGSSEYINFYGVDEDDFDPHGANYAISLWAKTNDANGTLWGALGGGGDFYRARMSSGTVGLGNNTGNSTSQWFYTSNTYNDDIWHKFTFIRTGSRDFKIIIDDSEIITHNIGGTTSTIDIVDDFQIGRYTTTDYLSGTIDEFRLIKGMPLTNDWVITEYNNQGAPSTFYSIGTQELESGGTINVSVNVNNVAPSFKSGTDVYEDPASDSTSPTDEGAAVTFKATAEDANEDNYFLIICSSNSVTAEGGTGNAPSCDATEYCVSSSTTAASGSEVEANCSYTTTGAESESNDWYAFVCDDVTGSICSSSSQGTLVDGSESPFEVNHDPTFTALNVDGADDPGGDVVFTATASDSDTNGTSDTVQMFVCDNSGATSSGCNGTEYCSSTSVASNPSCTYNYPAVIEDGNYTVYGHVFDSHGLASASNPQTADYTVNNVAPVASSIVVNGGSDITLTESTTTEVKVTGTITDNNSCQDILSVLGEVYRESITSLGCVFSPDDNNCYIQPSCTVVTSGDTCDSNTDASADYECTFDVEYHADPTDVDTEYPSETWYGFFSVGDFGSLDDQTESAAGVEMLSLTALDITTSIDYGALNAGSDTGATNQPVTVTATGNVGLDTDLSGNEPVSGKAMCSDYPVCSSAGIPVGNQKYDSSDVTYSSLSGTLSTTATELELNVAKTTVSASPATSNVYWGITIPGTITSGAYTGENYITAIKGEVAGW